MSYMEIDQAQVIRQLFPRAFADDPMFAHIRYDAVGRQRLMRWFFLACARLAARGGEVHLDGDRAGAIWIRPGAAAFSLSNILRSGWWHLPRVTGLRGLLRFAPYGWHALRSERRHHAARCWFLLALAVDPDAQGQGLGRAIVQPVLDRADREGVSCYLETVKSDNLSFYRRLGFEVVYEARLSADRSFWALVRPTPAANQSTHS